MFGESSGCGSRTTRWLSERAISHTFSRTPPLKTSTTKCLKRQARAEPRTLFGMSGSRISLSDATIMPVIEQGAASVFSLAAQSHVPSTRLALDGRRPGSSGAPKQSSGKQVNKGEKTAVRADSAVTAALPPRAWRHRSCRELREWRRSVRRRRGLVCRCRQNRVPATECCRRR
jgi:hypothetical protein